MPKLRTVSCKCLLVWVRTELIACFKYRKKRLSFWLVVLVLVVQMNLWWVKACAIAALLNFCFIGTAVAASECLASVLQPCAPNSPASTRLPALHWLLCFAYTCFVVLVYSTTASDKLTCVMHVPVHIHVYSGSGTFLVLSWALHICSFVLKCAEATASKCFCYKAVTSLIIYMHVTEYP